MPNFQPESPPKILADLAFDFPDYEDDDTVCSISKIELRDAIHFDFGEVGKSMEDGTFHVKNRGQSTRIRFHWENSQKLFVDFYFLMGFFRRNPWQPFNT